MAKPVAEMNIGDYHFELHKEGDKFKCLRSDVSDPAAPTEELIDPNEIPPQVFSIFQGLMY